MAPLGSRQEQEQLDSEECLITHTALTDHDVAIWTINFSKWCTLCQCKTTWTAMQHFEWCRFRSTSAMLHGRGGRGLVSEAVTAKVSATQTPRPLTSYVSPLRLRTPAYSKTLLIFGMFAGASLCLNDPTKGFMRAPTSTETEPYTQVRAFNQS
jgi:hypothetical protein